MRNRVARLGLWSACLVAVAALASSASGQQRDGEPADGSPTVIRDGFETAQDRLAAGADRRDGQDLRPRADQPRPTKGSSPKAFQFEAGIGGGLYYSYKLPNIPVTDDLKVSLYVRSNRSGAQILGRVVLPSDIDPDSRRPSFVLVPGTIFESSDRWQKLELDDMIPSIERQAKVLRSVDQAAGEPERGVPRAAGDEHLRRRRGDRGLPGRADVGPVSAAIAQAPRRRAAQRAVGPDDRRPAEGAERALWRRSSPASTPRSSSTGTA